MQLFGLGQIVLAWPSLLMALKWAGAAYLLWLAWKIASARPGAPDETPPPVGFVGAMLFQGANPKGLLAASILMII